MFRLVLLGSILFYTDAKSNCFTNTLKNAFVIPKTSKNYTLTQFENALQKAYPRSAWKRKLLSDLWKPELEKGLEHLNLNQLLHQKNPFFHYAKLPIRTAQTFVQAALEKGLSPAHRYLVIPAKLLITEAVLHPWKNAALVLALGADDVILDSLNLSFNDPILDESDPKNLKEDEMFVIVMLDQDKIRDDGNIFIPFGWNEARALVKKDPKKFMILDLSKHETYKENISKLNDLLLKNHQKIKKMVISSHAAPGYLESSNSSFVGSPTNLANGLEHLKKSIKPGAEVFFNGCNLARGDAGKEIIQNFASTLLPVGSKVYANETLGMAGGMKLNISNPVSIIFPQSKFFSVSLRTVVKPLILLKSKIDYEDGPGVGKMLWDGDQYIYEYTKQDSIKNHEH